MLSISENIQYNDQQDIVVPLIFTYYAFKAAHRFEVKIYYTFNTDQSLFTV